MAEALSLNEFNLAIKKREVMTLRRLITEFRIPEWHPCPCPSDTLAKHLDRAYIERLRETNQKALLPVLVIGNYVLTSTCLYIASAKSRDDEVLDKARVEVWSLGDYSDEDRFAVMALTAELCRAQEDKGTTYRDSEGKAHRDIKLEYAKELVKGYVVDVARKYGPGQAMNVIDELERGFHVMELVEVFMRFIKSGQRTAYEHVKAVTLDREFMNELRQLITERFSNSSNNNNVENVASKLAEGQKDGIVQDAPLFIGAHHATNVGTVDRGGRESLAQVSTGREDSLKRRLALEKVKKSVGNFIDISPLRLLSADDLNALSKRASELPPSEREEYLRRIISLVKAGKIGETKAMIYGKPEPGQTPETGNTEVGENGEASMEEGNGGPKDAETSNALFKGTFEFACSEDVCNAIRELSRASLRNDTKAMLKASLALSSVLANSLGMETHASLLNTISRNTSNTKLINLLLTITDLAEKSPGTAWAIADLTKAVKDGNLRELCAAFNDLVMTTINNMPKETRETIKGKVKPIECTQYPGPEELGL